MKKVIIIKKTVKIFATIIATLFALVLVSLILGWTTKHFGQLYLEDEEFCVKNTCFKMGTKGGYGVVFKSEDGKKWKETFPYGKFILFIPIFENIVFHSFETSGNTVWVTTIAPAPGESDGNIVGIYYSHDLGVTWNKLPHELSRHYSMLTFDENGNGKLITEYWENINGEIIMYINHYYKASESKEWILDNQINH
jgi:hypothetical protein